VTPVVIDASAGAEIVTDTRRGRALLRLLPADADPWVPEHFYAEVLALIRRQALVTQVLDEAKARSAVTELGSWQLRRATVRPLLEAAWAYRHNMTAADAIYVALAQHLHAAFLTEDHNLIEAPTFPAGVLVLRLAGPR
jgi:predicted nucleic acid-binding protein